MREILFRGKCKDGWFTGGIVRSCGIYCIARPFHSPYGLIQVNQDTVSQYTGLEDINEVKIFEGDILNSAIGAVFKVVYEVDKCSFHLEFIEDGDIFESYNLSKNKIDEIQLEVIGNKWDNKELLE